MQGSLLQLFPTEKRKFWSLTAKEQGCIQEIRLRAGLPVMILKKNEEWYLDENGEFTNQLGQAYCVSETEMEELLLHICHYSIYAYEDELKQGFITVAGGHRIGLAGRAVLEGDGSIRTLKHISYMNIRVSHQIRGAGDKILPLLYRQGRLQNTLIISPPGCGKTTLLRDLVRQVSDGNPYGEGLRVGLVDERSEIAGCFMGRPQNDVGIRTDVLDGCPKAQGMMLLLRAMSPQVVAIDELGSKEECKALRMAASCGSRILATIHGEGMEDVLRREGMDTLFEERLFELFLILEKQDGCCAVKRILRKEEAYDEDNRKSDGAPWMHGNGILVSQPVYPAFKTFAYNE